MSGMPSADLAGLSYAALQQHGAWAIQLETGEDFQIATVRSGQCWFECAEFLPGPVLLRAGAIVGVTGRTRQLWSQADRVSANTRPAGSNASSILPLTAEALRERRPDLVNMLFGTLPLKANPSLHAFPRLFYVPAEEVETISCLNVLFELIEREGSEAAAETQRGEVVNRASEILLIILARYVARQSPGDCVWGRDAIDPKLLRALRLIETEAARNWTVESLAAEVGMGRSAFAIRFRELVGDTPVNCLFKTRMRFASDMICARGNSVAIVAEAIGYQSESAFSKAFVRHFGMTPGRYRAAANDRVRSRPASDTRGHQAAAWRPGAIGPGQALALHEADVR